LIVNKAGTSDNEAFYSIEVKRSDYIVALLEEFI